MTVNSGNGGSPGLMTYFDVHLASCITGHAIKDQFPNEISGPYQPELRLEFCQGLLYSPVHHSTVTTPYDQRGKVVSCVQQDWESFGILHVRV